MIETFGTLPSGEDVQRITLADRRLSASILTYGASLQSLHLAPHPFSLVLGFSDLEAYLANPYFGAMVGRVANRIDKGQFALHSKVIQLDCNEHGKQTLHGGSRSIAFRNWRIEDHGSTHVTLTITDKPEHAGFPGDCEITVTYRLKDDGLIVETEASSNETTICNIAHHSYFNLSGTPDILDHELQIAADHYLPINSDQIPTGEITPVADTLFDFRKLKLIGKDAAEVIDHNYCLNAHTSPACRLHSPESGITMRIETTQPGLQVFTANGITTAQAGHLGKPYQSFCGIALEHQHWPDTPNHAHFPGIVLNAGDTYRETSHFRFSN